MRRLSFQVARVACVNSGFFSISSRTLYLIGPEAWQVHPLKAMIYVQINMERRLAAEEGDQCLSCRKRFALDKRVCVVVKCLDSVYNPHALYAGRN